MRPAFSRPWTLLLRNDDWMRLLLHQGQDSFLILENQIKLVLVFLDGHLVALDIALVLFDGFLILLDGLLIGNDRLLIFQNGHLIGDDLGFSHEVELLSYKRRERRYYGFCFSSLDRTQYSLRLLDPMQSNGFQGSGQFDVADYFNPAP